MSRNNPIVCTCCTVRERDIVDAIEAGAASIEDIGRACEAGTGCHTCHPTLLILLEEDAREKLARDEAPDSLQQLGLFKKSGAVSGPPAGPGGAARKPAADKTSASAGTKRPQPDSAE